MDGRSEGRGGGRNIIDLFAGCGGMSLGFSMAGFEPVAAIETDEWAGETYAHNHPKTRLWRGDIRDARDWDSLIPSSARGGIDGIVCGLPCQGFSLSGGRDPKDPRNGLFMEFARCLRHFRPRFFVIENVPGLLSMRTAAGLPVIEAILVECSAAGYAAAHSVLNAADFGVPQSRKRLFIVGVEGSHPFPPASLFPRPSINPEDRLTVDMATSDLPPISAGEGSEEQEYPLPPLNAYQSWAREKSACVLNHVAMRHTRRIVERFKAIAPGQGIANVPEEHSAAKRGDPSSKSGKAYAQNNMRVRGDRPCPTVAASFQSNFVHPHLDRNFTAREGARLQSFPDAYLFMGKRTTMSWEKHLSQYQQIGNAVPPLLARAVGLAMMGMLDRPGNAPSRAINFTGARKPSEAACPAAS